MTLRAPQPSASKGVILVSEAFTEINAGLVIVLASGHRRPPLETAVRTPEDWQAEIKGKVFDLVQCAQRIYTGAAASTSKVLIDRTQ